MNTVHAVFSPIFGIALHNFDELNLGAAKLFRNPATLAFSGTNIVGGVELPLPNVRIPSDAEIKGIPQHRLAYLKRLGIAKYLLSIEIETPTNELSSERVKEELEWAVLPLRILTDARILTGNSDYCQGGCVHVGLAEGGIIERVRRDGVLAPTLIPQGDSITGAIAEEDSREITKFASIVSKHRSVLSSQLAGPIDTFSNSFYLVSYTDRVKKLLTLIEGLFSEKGSKRGIRDKVASRAANFAYGDGTRIKRKQMQNLIGQAFDIIKKDIEHARTVEGRVTEEYSVNCLEELENVIRCVFFKAIHLLDQGKEPKESLPGLTPISASKKGGRKRVRSPV